MTLQEMEQRGRELIAARYPAYATMERLREDAVERGLRDLAIVYGWSAIRIGQEAVAEAMRGLKR
jgi:hypothetical protein